MSNPYGRAWRNLRRLILARDRGVCQLRLDGCTHRATQVDHVVSLLRHGSSRDPLNLQAACRSCNVAKRNLEQRGHIVMPGPSRDW